jgi:hypothetical protein
MKQINIRTVALIVTIQLLAAVNLKADDKPVQIALFNPVQIFSSETAISGVRFNLVYGSNASVTGLDFGLVNRTTDKQSVGVQWGILGLSERGFKGFQVNAVNITNEEFIGVQFGFVNAVEDGNGVMIGVINFARRMYGLQIGIINLISEGGAAPLLPIVNWSF